MMATPLVLAASTIRYRSSKEEKQTTKTTYDYKKPLKTVITTVFSGLLMFILTYGYKRFIVRGNV